MAINYHPFCKTEIEFCTSPKILKLCEILSNENIILVMSKHAAKRLCMNEFIKRIQIKNTLLWIDETVSYPTQQTLAAGLEKTKGFDANTIIAIGGGSSIDFAKGLKAFYKIKPDDSAENITQYLETGKIAAKSDIRLIAVPTTAGTGSELTQWATIWDYKKKRKYSIDHPTLSPDMAFIIPELTLTADENLTISTALDALSHAIEAYWSKKTTPLVRGLASEAIRITVDTLPKTITELANLHWREKLCLASVLSGLAFSATRTTACHSVSYPLTMDFHIPHGIAVAITLEKVASYNSGSYPDEKEMMDIFGKYHGIGGFLKTICSHRVSLHLRDYHVREKDIPYIAEKSFTLGRMDNNPVSMTKEDLKKILFDIL